jgi:hypothetical protein
MTGEFVLIVFLAGGVVEKVTNYTAQAECEHEAEKINKERAAELVTAYCFDMQK